MFFCGPELPGFLFIASATTTYTHSSDSASYKTISYVGPSYLAQMMWQFWERCLLYNVDYNSLDEKLACSISVLSDGLDIWNCEISGQTFGPSRWKHRFSQKWQLRVCK